MGLLDFLSHSSEESLRRTLREMIAEYQATHARLTRQRGLIEALRHIRMRVEHLEGQLRAAKGIGDRTQRLAHIQRVISEEKPLIENQKRLAAELDINSAHIMKFAKKTQANARRMRRA